MAQLFLSFVSPVEKDNHNCLEGVDGRLDGFSNVFDGVRESGLLDQQFGRRS